MRCARLKTPLICTVTYLLCFGTVAFSEPWSGPGDLRLRNDLQLLNDTGVINLPLTAWPVPWGDIHNSIAETDAAGLSVDVQAAFNRVRQRSRDEMVSGSPTYRFGGLVGNNPRQIRSFENTPRDEGEVFAGVSWVGNRFAINLQATGVDDPRDGDEFRPDGTYVGAAVGNWMLSAGWQERWWGPGRDGSMILSTSARPMPSVGIQRNLSLPSESKWFRWMGPWTLTSFMGLMDDERVIKNGWLWGLRASFRPVRGLEIGLSRTAQWCGDGRKCDLRTLLRVLNGNDNQGANVDPEDEPGNQLGGIDLRWVLPKQIPLAIYMQWTAEDTRKTGAQLHQWLRQVGVEHWGRIGTASHRTHFEFADTSPHLGSLGEGSSFPNSAYNHSIFRTGYRYDGRAIGHTIDGDGLSYTFGSTVVQSSGNTWNVSLRRMKINRIGQPDLRHTVSSTPQDIVDVQVTYSRSITYGRLHIGVGYDSVDDSFTQSTISDTSGFIRWTSR